MLRPIEKKARAPVELTEVHLGDLGVVRDAAPDAPGASQAPDIFLREEPDSSGRSHERPTHKKRRRDAAERAARPSAPRIPGKLTQKRIRNIAEFYVNQRDCTQAMLEAVLKRRLDRRLRTVGEEDREGERAEALPLISAEIARLVRVGLIDDARYAENKARIGLQSGRGTRRILVDLARKGISGSEAEEALVEAARETTGIWNEEIDAREVLRSASSEAAHAYARKRKIGPYRRIPLSDDPGERRKMLAREMSSMARAGFDLDVIREIMDAEPPEDDPVY